MASSRFLSPHPLVFFFTLIFSSATSPIFSISNITPLALNCTQSLKSTTNNQTGTLLESLTTNITLTRFTTGSIGHEPDRLTGLMQCRLHLSAQACRICILAAKQTLTSLCPNSNAVAVWFDGCYIHYHSSSLEIRAFANLSSRAYATNRAQFDSALETLLLQLRAGVRISSRRGFYTGSESYYGVRPGRIYALVECLRSVSPENCDTCVAEGIKRVHDCCGGKEGGEVVVGSCTVRFESYQFFSDVVSSEVADGSDSDESVSGYEERESGRFVSLKKKIVSAWGVAVALLMVVVLGGWLLRRRVLFTKVATVLVEITEEK